MQIMSKYGFHIQNISHMVNMLNGHIDPMFLHIYTITQLTATSTSSVIAKYVPETNMSTKLGIYAKYFKCIYGGCMCIHMSYITIVY